MDRDIFTIEDLKKRPVEHYLGYHTVDTMEYGFDEAEPFTLVTSNAKEADDVSCWSDYSKNGFIWVIEGVKEGRLRRYYLREVFQPTRKAEKLEGYFVGKTKKFDYLLEGEGVKFDPGILLNNLPWFPEFKKRNGSFGFGLRILADESVKAELIDLAEKRF
ncbi:hypothetical protein [Deinococcus sp. RIT780]|uniref:hypothetical protein n=1 Tax=Deinococcus sp. RIT780 TaxID=2870472 RepID=UPI001C8A5692|nr:hypothetical protein [Deinococcus sp. RIT780]MBX8466816.1 hypothetical protein [Deinococcus sp. RIT780]